MIISRTPLRISFAGGGTDLPSFYRQHAGCVVSTSVDKYIYITVNRKFDERIRVSYSETEMVDTVDQVKHGLVREALRMTGIEGGVEITSISDIFSQGSGLGSSSSYTVGLLRALYSYKGTPVSAERIAREASEIEIDILKSPIGKQDQYAASYGGLNYLQFNPDDSVFTEPVILKPENRRLLESNLMLFYTGRARKANNILAEQNEKTATDGDVQATLRRIATQARDLRDSLLHGDIDAVGEVMHQGWNLKRQLASGIANPDIDKMYEASRKAGAVGGKILGAGGGGFMLVYVRQAEQEAVKAALPSYRLVPLRFEPEGSRIVFYQE